MSKNLATRVAELREAAEQGPDQFIGTFAHSVNNFLAGVIGYKDIVKMTLEEGDENLDKLEELSEAANSLAAANREIGNASRKLYGRSAYADNFTPQVFYESVWASLNDSYGKLIADVQEKLSAIDMPGNEDIEVMRSGLTSLIEFMRYSGRLFDPKVVEYDPGLKKARITAPELKPGEEGSLYEVGNKETCQMVILDDDPSVLAFYVRVVTDKNIKAYATNSQERAIDAVLGHNPDRVLTDFSMPRMNGVQVVEKLRQGGYQGQVYIVTGDRIKDVTGIPGVDALQVNVLKKPFTEETAGHIFEFSNGGQ
jgi:CheY-like chemotaxis protein